MAETEIFLPVHFEVITITQHSTADVTRLNGK